jgi:hypothetical protein
MIYNLIGDSEIGSINLRALQIKCYRIAIMNETKKQKTLRGRWGIFVLALGALVIASSIYFLHSHGRSVSLSMTLELQS